MAKRLAATAKDLSDEQFARFRAALLEHEQEADYNDLSADALERLSASLWAFAEQRRPGETKVRLRVEDGGKEGSQERFTVLEIITDDRPFLVASVLAEIGDADLRVSWIAHPILALERDEAGRRVHLASTMQDVRASPAEVPRALRESMIQIAFTRALEPSDAGILEHRVSKVLADTAIVVADWRAMQDKLKETISGLYAAASAVSKDTAEEIPETIAFLEWLGDNHFIFMGVRDYDSREGPGGIDLVPIIQSSLGVLRQPDLQVLRRQGQTFSITPALAAFLRESSPIVVTKANVRSQIQRRVHMDYIGVKRFAADGRVVGERRYIGLFTSAAYNRVPEEIPLLRRKVRRVQERADFPAGTHNYNSLQNILETYPRDELFQISLDELFDISTGIMRLLERPRPRLFARFDKFDRFVSVLVFVPRERFNSGLREKIGVLLKEAFDGRISAFYPQLSDSPLVRIHFIIGRNIGLPPEVDLDELEERVAKAVRSWRDELGEALARTWGEGLGRNLLRRFGEGFTAAYCEAFTPREAIEDITRIDELRAGAIGIVAYKHSGDAAHELRIKLYRRGEIISLSRSLPILENLGLSVVTEFSYPVTALCADEKLETVNIHDFLLTHPRQKPIDLAAVRGLIETAFPAVWRGDAEDDGFHRLIIEAGLEWSEAALLRALARYLLQTGTSLSQSYMEAALAANPGIARLMVELFRLRCDPDIKEGDAARTPLAKSTEAEIHAALEDVQVLDQDRILRRLLNLMNAIVRTNFYQRSAAGVRPEVLAFKLDSKKIESLPPPSPLYEIFVYSPRVEGVHLRFGRVARGGIRWSDRREDFRTEILGLVKAQYVKNAVIVPSGSKGGFVCRRLPLGGTREDIQNEGVACYKLFIAALLDLTDNLSSGDMNAAPIPPPRTVVADPPDPYLVVAADKGTASFSDIANAIAVEKNFWLGDAFASGGSNGYDHKAMAITAKGAWVAVERHFRELGRNIAVEPFTVAGVGDMSGDVFGNGMLRSRAIRLIAAFDHRDIFLDPDPDPEMSFKERERMFALPRSSWQDYDKSKISRGGGVFSRAAKTIPLSPEARAVLGVRASALSAPELIRAILKADIDLLWFGGIGTFVKTRAERHADVGDSATDPLRVDAEELRAKVIGEGANLGLTQGGRIAFARKGSRINTDAIDNSGGVDCSDHEVNIKILLDMAVAHKAVTVEKRNTLLREMTNDVAALVLRDNYEQTLTLTLAETTSREDLDAHSRFIRMLEREGRLNRAVERLPSEDQLAELKAARRQGLTRPEIAVLLAYSKIQLRDDLIASDVPDQAVLQADLIAYFPAQLAKSFRTQILGHRLRREITATCLANELINLGGLTMVNRMRELTGASAPAVACAYAVARDVFEVREIRKDINALDNQIAAEEQTKLHNALRAFLRRQVNWILRRAHNAPCDIGAEVAAYRAPVAELVAAVLTSGSKFQVSQIENEAEKLTGSGVPSTLANAIARLEALVPACDVVDIARDLKIPVASAATAHGALGEVLGLERLFAAALHLTSEDHWERLAIRRLVEDLAEEQAALARAALRGGILSDARAAVRAWADTHKAQVARVAGAFDELQSAGSLTAARLALASGHVRDLVAAARTD